MMRKKLRNQAVQSRQNNATGLEIKGLQPSAQEVAQRCATSCAPSKLLLRI